MSTQLNASIISKQIRCHIDEHATKSFSELERDINIEQSISNDYRGRAIFEFFQNAIDRANKNIWITLDKNTKTLTIANDGKPFTIGDKSPTNKTDFHALLTTHNSSKLSGESIGNKGVGFKSCWEYTNHVTIATYADELAWGFEIKRDLTQYTVLNHINTETSTIQDWLNTPDIQKVLTGKELPSFYFPKRLEETIASEILNNFNNQDEVAQTVIVFKELTQLDDLEEKIRTFAEHQIFLTRQLDSLKDKDVILDLSVIHAEKSNTQNHDFHQQLHTKENNDDWHLATIEFTDEQLAELKILSGELNYAVENPKIAIAFPLTQDINIQSRFYCHLPTEIDCGFNVLIHGDFLLDVSRKQIDFKSNPYNKKLLAHAASLLVDTLISTKRLHEVEHFAKFLLPSSQCIEFNELVKIALYSRYDTSKGKLVLTEILTQVYQPHRLPDASYESLFQVMKSYAIKVEGDYRKNLKRINISDLNTVLELALIPFCHKSVYIVPVGEKGVCAIPSNDASSLFARKKQESTNTRKNNIDYDLLSYIPSFTISDFEPLSSFQQLQDLKWVKAFTSNLEVVRALKNATDSVVDDNNNILSSTLKFAVQLYQEEINSCQDQNIDYLLNYKQRDRSPKNHLAQLKLPCFDHLGNSSWQPAKICYHGLNDEVKSLLLPSIFYQVDLSKLSASFSLDEAILNPILKYFGVWQVLPLDTGLEKENLNILSWKSTIKFPTNSQLKHEILKAFTVWKNIDEPLLLAIKKQLSQQAWYWDEINEKLAKPAEVFLFNDKNKRTCIAQGYKHDDIELHTIFDINSIDETTDDKKIAAQLQKMAASNTTIDSYHKTLYKQLVYRYARLEIEAVNLPLLVRENESEYYVNAENLTEKAIWHVAREQKKYKYQVDENLVFLIANDDLSDDFAKKQGCAIFQPEYKICYINNKEQDKNSAKDDSKCKAEIATSFLATLLTLAESNSGVNLDKTLIMQRWNELKINKADDVYLSLTLAGEETILHEGTTGDVLYKPLTRSQRIKTLSSDNLTKVGEIAHDLSDPVNDENFYKFGSILADALFRDNKLGAIFEVYFTKWYLAQKSSVNSLNTRASIDCFLKDYGVHSHDIKDNEAFIEQYALNEKELSLLIDKLQTLETVTEVNESNVIIDKNNWNEAQTYQTFNISFTELKSELEQLEFFDKIKTIINQLDPTQINLQKVLANKNNIMCHMFYSSNAKYVDFDKKYQALKDIIKDEKLRNVIGSFNFNIEKCFSYFGCDKEPVSEDMLLQAKILIDAECSAIDTSTIIIEKTSANKSSTQLFANAEIHCSKKSQDSRELEQKAKHKRGMAAEMVLSVKWAQKIVELSDKKKLIEDINALLDDPNMSKEASKIKAYRGILETAKENNSLRDWVKVLQVSESLGDGLGYDVLEPVLGNDGYKSLNRVEVKYSQHGSLIYLSKNELQKILAFHKNEDMNWKLYHCVNKQVIDRTKAIRTAVCEYENELKKQDDISIQADSWFIDFSE